MLKNEQNIHCTPGTLKYILSIKSNCKNFVDCKMAEGQIFYLSALYIYSQQNFNKHLHSETKHRRFMASYGTLKLYNTNILHKGIQGRETFSQK